jgi:hypothetical protein
MPSPSTPPLAPLPDGKSLLRAYGIPTVLEGESEQEAILEDDLGRVRAGAVEEEGVSRYDM